MKAESKGRSLRSCVLLVALSVFAVPTGGLVGHGDAPAISPRAFLTAPGDAQALRPTRPNSPATSNHYTLTPEKRAKAIAYARANYAVYFLGTALSLGIYLFIWQARIAVAFRNWARSASSHRFVQCLIFVSLLLLVVRLLKFPLVYYSGFVLEHRFELSDQTLASWLADEVKAFAVTASLGVLVVSVFIWVARRSPRRWWFYFWLVTLPMILGLILIEPYVIDPLFFKFTRLEKTHLELTTRIEEMLGHAGLDIPRARIFEMDASAKTKTLNAYVAGFGPSQRVVIWDNTLRKMSEDEALLVVGHETGHYVLHHIPKEFALIELVALGLFYLGFVMIERLVAGPGRRTGIESLADLASLPIALLVLTTLSFLSSPVVSAISRHYEHQADQYGIELAYGVVADPNAAEVRSLQVSGEEDLDDPDPHPFIKFWLYSHPPLDERIRFATGYKPWAEGKPLQLIRTRH